MLINVRNFSWTLQHDSYKSSAEFISLVMEKHVFDFKFIIVSNKARHITRNKVLRTPFHVTKFHFNALIS